MSYLDRKGSLVINSDTGNCEKTLGPVSPLSHGGHFKQLHSCSATADKGIASCHQALLLSDDVLIAPYVGSCFIHRSLKKRSL